MYSSFLRMPHIAVAAIVNRECIIVTINCDYISSDLLKPHIMLMQVDASCSIRNVVNFGLHTTGGVPLSIDVLTLNCPP